MRRPRDVAELEVPPNSDGKVGAGRTDVGTAVDAEAVVAAVTGADRSCWPPKMRPRGSSMPGRSCSTWSSDSLYKRYLELEHNLFVEVVFVASLHYDLQKATEKLISTFFPFEILG